MNRELFILLFGIVCLIIGIGILGLANKLEKYNKKVSPFYANFHLAAIYWVSGVAFIITSAFSIGYIVVEYANTLPTGI